MAFNRPFSLYWQETLKQRLAEQRAEEELKKLEEQNFNSLYNTSGPKSNPLEKKVFEPFKNIEKSTTQALAFTPTLTTNRKLTLTELKNNPEFADTAERFMDSISRNENIFEYLRDANFSLSSAAQRAVEIKEWDEQTIQDYTYLKQKFDNAEIGSFKERLGLVKDLGGDILLDPVNWLTALFAVPSGGGALGAKAIGDAAVKKSLAKLAEQGSKRYVKSKFEKDVSTEAAKRFGILGAAEGSVWSGAHDYFLQDIDVNLGLTDEIDMNRVGVSTAIGTFFGGAVGAGIGKYTVGSSYSKMLEKEYKFANEANVDVFVGKQIDEAPFYKIGDEQPEPKQATLFDDVKQPTPKKKQEIKNPRKEEETEYNKEQEEINFLDKFNEGKTLIQSYNPIKLFSRIFVEKPTSKFIKALEKFGNNASPTMMNNLRKLRTDVEKGILKATTTGTEETKIILPKAYTDEFDIDGPKSNVTTQSYGEYFGELIGKYHVGLEQAFGVLGTTGVFRYTLNQNDNVRTLMQNKNIVLIRERQIDSEGNRGAYTGKETIYKKTLDEKTGFETFNTEVEVGDTVDGIKLDAELHFSYRRLRGLYDDVYDTAVIEGLIDGDKVSKLGYFPRIFNYGAVERNRAVLEKRIIDAGHANPDNTRKAYTDFLDKEGVPIDEAFFKPDLGVDYNTFNALREQGFDSFEDLTANIYYKTLSKNQKKNFNVRSDVKQFLKENKLKPSQSYKFLKDKITKENENLTIDLSKIKHMDSNDTVSLYEFAQIQKAKYIVDDMLNKKYIPQELKAMGSRYGEGSGFLQSRVFYNIKDKDIQEFLEDDVMNVSNKYFNNAAQILSRTRYYGKNIKIMEEDIFQKIIQELTDSGVDIPTAQELTKEFRQVIRKVTGLDQSHLESWWNTSKIGRPLGDLLKLSQQMAHLPLATLSSITEPMILLTRDFSTETAGTIGKSLVSETGNMFDRIGRGLKRARGQSVQGRQSPKRLGIKKTKEGEYYNVGRFSDDDWFELYQTGLALEQTVMERIEGLAGEALHGSGVKLFQNMFFKSNILTQWTRAVQLASYTTGKRIIRQHARALATEKTGLGNKLSAGKRRQIIEELNELNINSEEAIAWYNRSVLDNGQLDENLAKGLNNFGELGTGEDFIKNARFNQKLIRGANRFTKEIILNPSVQEANRPLWFSNPNAQFLMQFAGYPTVFTNTVLKRFAREVAKDGSRQEMYRTGRILPTVLLMTAVAHVGNELRSNGKATFEYGTDEKKPTHKIINDAWRRWGGLGPLDYANRYVNEAQRGTGFVAETLKSFTGPLPQDVVDAILYRKGLSELAITNAPYFQLYDAIFGEGTKKKLKSLARGTKPKEKKRNPRLDFEKGGLVYNVPNVKNEPDEMQSRVTGQPFNSTAEFVQDEEDRALKGQMEGLGLRKPFMSGALVLPWKLATKQTFKKIKKIGNNFDKNFKDINTEKDFALNKDKKMKDYLKKLSDEELFYLEHYLTNDEPLTYLPLNDKYYAELLDKLTPEDFKN